MSTFVTCQHIRQNGAYCDSPALKDRDLCYFHLRAKGARLRAVRHQRRHQLLPVELPLLEDFHAVQVGIQRVLEAMSEDRIDGKRGGAMLYGLQLAGTNLKRVEAMRSNQQPTMCTEYPGFEEEFGLNEPEPEVSAEAAAAAGTRWPEQIEYDRVSKLFETVVGGMAQRRERGERVSRAELARYYEQEQAITAALRYATACVENRRQQEYLEQEKQYRESLARQSKAEYEAACAMVAQRDAAHAAAVSAEPAEHEAAKSQPAARKNTTARPVAPAVANAPLVRTTPVRTAKKPSRGVQAETFREVKRATSR